MTLQAQVKRHGLLYEDVFFSSATIPGETIHCYNVLAVFREEGPDEGLFEKYPVSPPPEIHNSTTQLSAPGDPFEAGFFNASYMAEDIVLVRNQGLEVDDDMELSPENVSYTNTPTSEKLFEGQT